MAKLLKRNCGADVNYFVVPDEELQRFVTLLLVELFLRVHQPDKALSVILTAENIMQNRLSLEDASNISELENWSENYVSKIIFIISKQRRFAFYKFFRF